MLHENIYLRPYTVGWNNEESDSLHLEYSYDKENWYALNGGNGILFAKAGSKRMSKPQIVKEEDGFVIYALDACDETKTFVYKTTDFVNYSDEEVVDTSSLSAYDKESKIVEIFDDVLSELNSAYGKPEPVVIESVENPVVKGTLPTTVKVIYSNGDSDDKKVTWGEADLSKPGTYQVKGKIYEHHYTNPIIYHRADPFIYRHTDGTYYFTASHTDMEHNLDGKYQYRNVTIRKAASLEDLADGCGKYEERVIYAREALPGDCSPHIWAPEIHYIDGAWYVYVTTTVDENNLWAIRPHVLQCVDADPMTGEWKNLGTVKTTTDDSIAFTDFSLDHTVLQHKGELYMFWAEKHPDLSDIYAAKMTNPWTIDSSRVTKVVEPKFNWEVHGFPVCEGPGFLVRNGKIFMTYSASGTDSLYCNGLLTASEDADLLDPASWTKSPFPVFQSSKATGQFGPGHNSFTVDEEGHDILVYHARQEEHYLFVEEGYEPLYDAGRNTSLMRIYWNSDGTPNFSVPAPSGKGYDKEIEVTATITIE